MSLIIMAAVIGVLFIVLIVVVYGRLASQARKVNLTKPESAEQKPEWMRTTPPDETIAATQEDGEGITLYDADPSEQVAAPFAEQIEDIVRSLLKADPSLASVELDFGTAADGGLEIWVDGNCYSAIDQISDERIRQALRTAVEMYEHR